MSIFLDLSKDRKCLTVAAIIVCTARSLKRMHGSKSGDESPHCSQHGGETRVTAATALEATYAASGGQRSGVQVSE